jgi:hypothetical protein
MQHKMIATNLCTHITLPITLQKPSYLSMESLESQVESVPLRRGSGYASVFGEDIKTSLYAGTYIRGIELYW